MIVSPLSPLLVRRLGTKAVVAAGLVVMAAGMFIAASSTIHSGYTPIFVSMVVMATGMGLAMAPATESIMGSLPKEKAGVGSAINDTTREVGGALGVAILGSIFSSSYSSGIHHHLTGTGLPANLVHAMGQSITAGTAIAQQLGESLASTCTARSVKRSSTAWTPPSSAGGVALVGAAVAAILLPSSASSSEPATLEVFAEPALAA